MSRWIDVGLLGVPAPEVDGHCTWPNPAGPPERFPKGPRTALQAPAGAPFLYMIRHAGVSIYEAYPAFSRVFLQILLMALEAESVP